MTSTSVIKLQKAGYSFIRVQEDTDKDGKKKYIIKQSTTFGAWTHFDTCVSKAACERMLKELDEDPKFIID